MFRPQHMAIFSKYILHTGHIQLPYYIVIDKW